MEIYMERIRDLLARASLIPRSAGPTAETEALTLALAPLPPAQNDNLQVHEEKARGVYVKGLTQYNVSEAAEVYQIMKQGQASRATSSTSASLR